MTTPDMTPSGASSRTPSGATTRESLDARVRDLVAAGDIRAAATEAIQHLGPEILQYVRSLLRDEDAAGDAFSDFAEHLWKGLATFRWTASLRTWAYRIATNAVADVRGEAWRRHGRRFATGEATNMAEELRTKTVVKVERQRKTLDALREALSMEERTLLSLRVDRGLSWSEISEVLSAEGKTVAVDALMKRFERLKEKLAARARELGLVE
jgi:RNA polymerase sigma-70 factor (ECF subfamily)